jgi:hypothetical protein
MDLSHEEVQQRAEADRREVDPPIQVEMATWSPGGQLDWWVKERRPRLEWFGRVRGKDGRQRTSAGWHSACRCTLCRRAHSDTQRAFGRARAPQRLPPGVRQELLDAIYQGKPFRTVLRELNLTSNQVWGLTKTDEEWSAAPP